jgi:membrane fusion protein (multidrug efflux system)
MPRVLAMLLLGSVVLGGCGKEEKKGPDLRKPPPVPKRDESGKPATSPSAAAPAPVAPGTPQIQVEVAPPVKRSVAITVDYTGQTIGSETVDVRARVEGFLKSIHFTEGTFVKQGDLLYEIDKDRILEAVEQAEGELNVARANAEKATADVLRNKPLVAKNAIAREEYETSVSAEKAAKAKVDAAAAAVKRAKINLGYATVTAPIDGLVGKTEVDIGNLVGRGEPTLLTTISEIDPIYAEVRVSETDFLHYQRTRMQGGRKVEDITLFFSDGTKHPQMGSVAVVDRNLDTKTGTILVQVSFPNPDRSVRPGQFARVQGVRERVEDALLVPQGAIDELQGTYRLYLLDEEGVVRIRPVKVGKREGPLRTITEGLEATDRVIVAGRQKVKDGAVPKAIPVTIGPDGKTVREAGAEAPASGEPAGGSR